MKIDYEQRRWLTIHGDRKEEDVLFDEKQEPYVLMFSPVTGQEKVYLPRTGIYLGEEKGGAK